MQPLRLIFWESFKKLHYQCNKRRHLLQFLKLRFEESVGNSVHHTPKNWLASIFLKQENGLINDIVKQGW